MTRREDDAIVLGIHQARDADRTVILVTASGELVPTIAPAAARSRRRFGGALMPGAVVHARWTVRREGAMAVLAEAQVLAPAPEPDPLDRFYVTAHLVELAREFAREGEEDPRLFRLLRAMLERVAAGDDPDLVARYFEAWMLRLAGLMPDIGTCSACGATLAGRPAFLSADAGAFCREHAPPGGVRLAPAAAAWLAATRHMAPDALAPLPGREKALLADALTGTITRFIERRLRAWPALVALRRSERAE